MLNRFAPFEALAKALLPHGASADTAHDLAHLARVWANVQRIAATEGGDLHLLCAATLLHDCVALPKDSPRRAEASRLAAQKAAGILDGLGWDPAAIEAVSHAIAAHSYSAAIPPLSLEAKILQDADRLDALGHIGIARCFAVSGALGRALYDPADPGATARAADDRLNALDHFELKLLRLAEGFQTEAGRRFAAERHRVVEAFRAGLLRELG